jgi:hypothetical protein
LQESESYFDMAGTKTRVPYGPLFFWQEPILCMFQDEPKRQANVVYGLVQGLAHPSGRISNDRGSACMQDEEPVNYSNTVCFVVH